MNRLRSILPLIIAAFFAAGIGKVSAQPSRYQELRGHNAAMTAVQPSWMGPLIQSDARLSQAVRISVSNADAPGAQIVSYGNNHGASMIGGTRFQFDFNPPSYFRNHSAGLKDGFGNAGAQVKYRIASGNAEHGNFALTAIVYHGFAPRAYENGLMTSYYCPKVAAGIAFGRRFDVQSTLGGFLPTGKIAIQGRGIEWNATAQVHPDAHTWFDVEDNTTFNIGGAADGNTQNFITPAAFYAVKRKAWGPAHAVVVFDAGMQIATSQFHLYNHNLISEMRILF